MLNPDQSEELLAHLHKAQNPVFLYDNDADGLCSFILLRRFLGRGVGVAVRTHPDVDEKYARKAHELGADYVFVLDRPFLGQSFLDALSDLHIPVIWIDHHEVPRVHYTYDSLHIYNPSLNKAPYYGVEPVTALVHELTGRHEDGWIALMGCIADHYLPKFAGNAMNSYKELWRNVREPFEAYYETELGKLAQALSFGLKDSITHLNYLHSFLSECTSPHDMLRELEGSSSFAKKHRELSKKYNSLLEKALQQISSRFIFFKYGGDVSISADLANELCYRHPKSFIVVAYVKGPIANLSLRGPNVRAHLEALLPLFSRASGGGHRDAVGARLQSVDLATFKERFEEAIS